MKPQLWMRQVRRTWRLRALGRRMYARLATHWGGKRIPSDTMSNTKAMERNLKCKATAGGAEIPPAVIVGGGRIGNALQKMGSGNDVLVRRGEKVPEGSQGPIFVCTRNDALDDVVEATPPDRREDLVFLQNGMLLPWLKEKGLEKNTQVLVYFAVAKMGDDPIDGKTDVNPEGLTAANGKWAQAMANRLATAELSCKVLDDHAFRASMMEKLIWISAFMLVGVKHPGASVGDVESKHRDEVVALIDELAAVSVQELGVKFEDGLVERLCAYARSVASYPTAVKEFEWRNGYFYSVSQQRIAQGSEDPCPLHTAWLKEVGAV